MQMQRFDHSPTSVIAMQRSESKLLISGLLQTADVNWKPDRQERIL